MPQFPHHVMTMGTTGEAAVGTAGGGAYYTRRKRWMAAFCFLLVVLC
jgi:hypothetical protein